MTIQRVVCLFLALAAMAFGADDAPEITAGTASTAIALIGGVVLTLRGRRPK